MGNTKGIDGAIAHALPFDLQLRSSEKGFGLVGEEELWVIAPDAFHNHDVLFRIKAMCNRIRAEALSREEEIKDVDYGL